MKQPGIHMHDMRRNELLIMLLSLAKSWYDKQQLKNKPSTLEWQTDQLYLLTLSKRTPVPWTSQHCYILLKLLEEKIYLSCSIWSLTSKGTWLNHHILKEAGWSSRMCFNFVTPARIFCQKHIRMLAKTLEQIPDPHPASYDQSHGSGVITKSIT